MKIFKIKRKDASDTDVKPTHFSINGKDYVAEYDSTIKVQSEASDVNVYGWVLETRYKHNDGRYSIWSSHWTNKIYSSKESAIDAALKIRSMYKTDDTWRVSPIYIMRDPEYRDYKINKILGTEVQKTQYEIKGWKLKEDYECNYMRDKFKKGTIFIQLTDGNIIISADSTNRHRYMYDRGRFKSQVLKEAEIEEIEIKDEKWLYPHLLKELKVKLKIRQLK